VYCGSERRKKKKLKERIVLTVLSHKPPPPFTNSCIFVNRRRLFWLVFSLDIKYPCFQQIFQVRSLYWWWLNVESASHEQ